MLNFRDFYHLHECKFNKFLRIFLSSKCSIIFIEFTTRLQMIPTVLELFMAIKILSYNTVSYFTINC